MFKVGDKVKIKDYWYDGYIGQEGKIVEIDDTDEDLLYRVCLDEDDQHWYREKHLELIEPATTSKTETVEDSKFKVGDRVKMKHNCYLGYEGKEGKISCVDKEDEIAPYLVDFDDNSFWVSEKLLEPVTEEEVISKMKTITPITPKCSFCELNQNLYSLDDYYSVKLDDNGIVELYQSCRLENIFAFDYCPCCGKKLKRFNRED